MTPTYSLQLAWPDGTTAIPLRGLDHETAKQFQAELQAKFNLDGRGTTIQAIKEASV